MNYKEAHKRLLAAQTILLEPTTSIDKFNSISTLIRGIHPELDAMLVRVEKELGTFGKIQDGQVIDLVLEHLPEFTEEEKKRKKVLLLFLQTWNKLKGEIARVDAELSAANSSEDSGDKTSHWGRIFNFAKGPLGIVTILAVGIVLVMQQTGVQLTIKNQGCGTMVVSGSMPISLPGLSLPSDPIASGGSGVAIIPPLSLNVDGTQSGILTLNALTFSATFQLPSSISDVTLDGISLLNKKQDVSLSGKKEHTLTLVCL